MDQSSGCTESYIQVFDGSNSNATQFGGKICGSSNPERLESMGRDVYLVYTSKIGNGSEKFKIGVNLPGISNR